MSYEKQQIYSFPLGVNKPPLPFYPPTSYLQGFINKVLEEDIPRARVSRSPESVVRRLTHGENSPEEMDIDTTYVQLYSVIYRFRHYSYFYNRRY